MLKQDSENLTYSYVINLFRSPIILGTYCCLYRMLQARDFLSYVVVVTVVF